MACLYVDNIHGSDSHTHSGSTTDTNGMDMSDVVDEDMEEEFHPQADDEEDGEVNSGPPFTGASASEAPTASMSEIQSTMPLWLDRYCKEVENMLKAEIQQSACNLACLKCHEQGHFWVWDESLLLQLMELECHKTYHSWSPTILNILPQAISIHFPFQLTYWSGLMKKLAELLHSSIRAGISPIHFTEMLQLFHYQCYDELQVQYLELIYTCMLAIDHSFKIIKWLGKVGSASLFTALHTTTNEHAEICSILFMMMKGHDHFILNLCQIGQSLKMFGHNDVQAVFMDNVCDDKDEVQQTFPSLLKDIEPIPSHTHQINLYFNIIMNHQSPENLNVMVAFDMEWPMDLDTGVHDLIALIQIAYQSTIYLIKYAILDAYATFLVHFQLVGMAVVPPVIASTPAGTSMIFVPEFLIPAGLCGTGIKHSQPLLSHGNPPFSLSANNSSLHIYVGNLNADNGLGNMHNPDSAGSPLPVQSVATVDTQKKSAVTSDPGLPDLEGMPEISQSLVLPFNDLSDEEDRSVWDQAAEVVFQTLIKPCLNNQNGLQQIHSTQSYVIYDNFHNYHHIPISHPHDLQHPFYQALSTAFFLPVTEDKAAVEVVLKKYCTSYNFQLLSNLKWILTWDVTTGQSLFNSHAWEVVRSLLENVHLGYYFDSVGVELYYNIGHDKNGLALYWCCCGTNSIKGGVHQNLIQHYTSFNTSPWHAINILLDYAMWHNMMVVVHSGWVNGNNYESANKTFGMIRLSPTLFKSLASLVVFPIVHRPSTPAELDCPCKYLSWSS
ncbi:hypothetical protein HD554DRAFT_2041439 [Boletus coccyginus]|nr:hypothetical protein HD554DRAFT_2041439 [Boletus coccyginus]